MEDVGLVAVHLLGGEGAAWGLEDDAVREGALAFGDALACVDVEGDAAGDHPVTLYDCLYARRCYLGVNDEREVAVGLGIGVGGRVLARFFGGRGSERLKINLEHGGCAVYIEALKRGVADLAYDADWRVAV